MLHNNNRLALENKELVYFWGKNYGHIPYVDMNFNPRFTFQYDEKEHKLEFNENRNVLNIFSHEYSNISNITAIVGENGQGKTAFLHFLVDVFNVELSRSAGNIKLEYLMIFFDGKKFYIYDNLTNNDIKIINNTSYEMKIFPKESSIHKRPNPPMYLIYHTNAFSFSEYRYTGSYQWGEGFSNISMPNLIRHGVDNDVKQDPIKHAQHIATIRQIAAWNKWIESKKSSLKPKLRIMMMVNRSNYEMVNNFIKRNLREDKENNNLHGKLLKIYTSIYQTKYVGREITVLQGVVYSLFQWLLLDATIKGEKRLNMISKVVKNWGKINIEEASTEYNGADFIMRYVEGLFNEFKTNLDVNVNYQTQLNGYRETIKFLLDYDNVDYDDYETSFYVKSDSVNLSQLYNNYQEAIGNLHEFLYFDWGMSTGEFARFDFFSYLYELSEKAHHSDYNKKLKNKSMLFLLDEIDLYLHPRWQQNFLGDLLEDMKQFFSDKHIQIIFTTHSPIFLSDIPADHVFYFTKDDEKDSLKIVKRKNKTFAANIYNLYHDAFFLNHSLIQTGSFASRIIREIYDEWKNLCAKKGIIKDDKIIEKIKKQVKIVDMIGEDLIRNALQNLYLRLMKKVSGETDSLTLYESIIMDYLDKSSKEQQKIKDDITKKIGL